jgi:hypothetical protein
MVALIQTLKKTVKTGIVTTRAGWNGASISVYVKLVILVTLVLRVSSEEPPEKPVKGCLIRDLTRRLQEGLLGVIGIAVFLELRVALSFAQRQRLQEG